ncbi:MAG: hypothetical protein QW332_07440 [Thermoproteota archaeon]
MKLINGFEEKIVIMLKEYARVVLETLRKKCGGSKFTRGSYS